MGFRVLGFRILRFLGFRVFDSHTRSRRHGRFDLSLVHELDRQGRCAENRIRQSKLSTREKTASTPPIMLSPSIAH